jgi:hypothetical protein
MEYADEMGLGTMIYIPSFIKIISEIRKLIEGIHIQTHRLMRGFYEVRR